MHEICDVKIMKDEEYRAKFGGEYYSFWISEVEGNSIILSIPEVSGHVSAPRSSQQEKWLQNILKGIPNVEQTWNTTWSIKSEKALQQIRQMLRVESEKNDEEEDYYNNLYPKKKV